jgi:DNA-binding NtrC family response regulator
MAPFVCRVGRALVITQGPDTGRFVVLGERALTIGSAEPCDVVLRDDTVSRSHLEIVPQGSEVLARDLDSRNGSFFRGARFREMWIDFGAEIRVGRTVLKFLPREEAMNSAPSSEPRYGELLGTSAPMRELFGLLDRVATRDTTVLLEGETGTGKELVAEEIHKHSERHAGPYVVFDCGTVARELLGSALFGHDKGAFTGADAPRRGAFVAANGGTLLLDEIGELPLEMQTALLRVLDKKQVRRLGTDRYEAVDVRVIAATHRDLRQLVERGAFREDLFYRLAVVRLRLPPLRERAEDLELLIKHFARTLGDERDWQLSERDLARLGAAPLHGNVRELRNLVERSLIHSDGSTLQLDVAALQEGPSGVTAAEAPALPPADAVPTGADALSFREARQRVVGGFERTYLSQLIKRHGGNLSAAARDAKIDRKQLRKLLERYDIERE